jgi:phospholipid/cholesterol/gamma-HCH transport system substrate-binding protein
MSKPVNKTLIGAFVLGAVVLVVAAVMVFGSGKFFTKKNTYVLFFDGSVKGLNVGSPVMFRGVKIGEVTNIKLLYDPKKLSAFIPVYVEIDPENFTLPAEGERTIFDKMRRYAYLKPLIEKGLKAQLQTQSFVTGQLMINVDFYPDKPIRLVGLDKTYPEVPTIPTSLQEVAKTLEQLPLKEIITKLELAIDGIQKIVSSPDTQEGIATLNLTLKDTRKLLQNVDEKISPLMESLAKTSDAAHDTLVQAKDTLAVIEVDGKELMQSTKNTIKTTEATLKQAENTLSTFSADSRLVYELNNTLSELSGAARSMRFLSEYLERHPEALLTGKKQK